MFNYWKIRVQKRFVFEGFGGDLKQQDTYSEEPIGILLLIMDCLTRRFRLNFILGYFFTLFILKYLLFVIISHLGSMSSYSTIGNGRTTGTCTDFSCVIFYV
jgi:hypothetical protein